MIDNVGEIQILTVPVYLCRICKKQAQSLLKYAVYLNKNMVVYPKCACACEEHLAEVISKVQKEMAQSDTVATEAA